MLVELAVENLAVVERLRLRLHPGFNALTGETGSGKSLIVGALSLLFGGRASADMIRTGEERAFVSGIFEAPADDRFRELLEQAGVAAEDGELLVEREITASGKSRAWAGSRPVTIAFLREIAPFLGDIHGQHDQQKLFSPEAQREMLDEAAGARELLAALREAWRAWRGAQRELAELDRAEQERARLADLWSMQRNEIAAAALKPGEDAQLENERRVLRNVARLSESVASAYALLEESEESAASAVGQALKRLEEAARIDATLEPLVETLRPAQIAIQEASHELRHYLGRLGADPRRLEEVESRLALIERLKRKYGTTIEEILSFFEDVSSRLAALESASGRRAELERLIAEHEAHYRELAGQLRETRLRAARRLGRKVQEELAGLAMPGAVFRIQVEPCEPGEEGMDAVQFLFSANAGEEPRPLDRVASGGELSRVALAIKTCMAPAEKGAARTLVFDEVDAGVGGAAGEMIGRRLRELARRHQVLCVTHLAQIAGFADHHYLVSKSEAGGRTAAGVELLGRKERIREIARMLSGQKLTPEALRHAEKLVEQFSAG
ncbi:MAG: DNA repair protein RecN [Bryobacteraceae bacterium]|nr:MAG: DNA repair protein RecN [Bryobacteraceae bacterium]